MREHVFVPQISRESGHSSTHFHLVLRKPGNRRGLGWEHRPLPKYKGCFSQSLSSLRAEALWLSLKFRWKEAKDSHSGVAGCQPPRTTLCTGAQGRGQEAGGSES